MANKYEIGSSGVVEPTFNVGSLYTDPGMKDLEDKLKNGTLQADAKKEKEAAEEKLKKEKEEKEKKSKEISSTAGSHYAGGGNTTQPVQADLEEKKKNIKDQEMTQAAEEETKKNLKKQSKDNMNLLLYYIKENDIPLDKITEIDDPKLKGLLGEVAKTEKALGNEDFDILKAVEEYRVTEEQNLTPKEKAAKDTKEGRDPSRGVSLPKTSEEQTEEAPAPDEEKVPVSAPVSAPVEEPKKPTDEELEKIMAENAPYKGHTPNFKSEEEAKKFQANEEEKAKRYAEAKAELDARKATAEEIPAPEEVTEEEAPVEENKEEASSTEEAQTKNGVKENKYNIYKENQAKIAELEEQLKDPNLTDLEREKLEEQAKIYKEANDTFINSLSTEESDIAGHAKEREQFEKYVTKQRNKGLIGDWISESREYKQLVNDAKDALKAAEESGDSKAIAAAKKDLQKAEKAKKDMHLEYGMFLLNALGTSLGNMSVPGEYGRKAGDAKSLYQQRAESNLKAETDRWNKYRDETMKAVSDDIDRRWGENSEMKQFYNSMIRDAAVKRNARELGLLDDAYKVEAVKKMSDSLGTDVKETLKLMSLMGMGSEQMIWKTISDSNIDLNALAETLANAAQAGIDGADRGLAMINSWLGKKE